MIVSPQTQRLYKSVIDFPRSGVYFLVLNYTSTQRTGIQVTIGDKTIPVLLPAGSNCLLILAGKS